MCRNLIFRCPLSNIQQKFLSIIYSDINFLHKKDVKKLRKKIYINIHHCADYFPQCLSRFSSTFFFHFTLQENSYRHKS